VAVNLAGPIGDFRPRGPNNSYILSSHPERSALTARGGSHQWEVLRGLYAQLLPCKCWRCDRIISPSEPWHLGHIVDRALGGSDDLLWPEHARCSHRSGAELGVRLARLRVLAGLAPRAPRVNVPARPKPSPTRWDAPKPSREW
jgi:hypothetical protein